MPNSGNAKCVHDICELETILQINIYFDYPLCMIFPFEGN